MITFYWQIPEIATRIQYLVLGEGETGCHFSKSLPPGSRARKAWEKIWGEGGLDSRIPGERDPERAAFNEARRDLCALSNIAEEELRTAREEARVLAAAISYFQGHTQGGWEWHYEWAALSTYRTTVVYNGLVVLQVTGDDLWVYPTGRGPAYVPVPENDYGTYEEAQAEAEATADAEARHWEKFELSF